MFIDDTPQKNMLDNMLKGLHDCMIKNKKTAELRVIGFTSTSGSNADNLKLANDRAKSVVGYIKKKVHEELMKYSQWIAVYPHKWSTYCEMKRNLIFKDTSHDQVYSEKAGLLNRRVEIHLMRFTECRLLQPNKDLTETKYMK